MQKQIKEVEKEIKKQEDNLKEINHEMSKIIVGQNKLISRLQVALLTRGHLLLEGVPGLAKTTAISSLAQVLKLSFQRIQFTPDLLPSDLLGNKVFNPKDASFYIKKGPIFANFILADEINRSPAKVQSALLETMQEGQVTLGEETFSLPNPFFVMATQNPVEQEGTYLLPEAQVDRFLLKVKIDYPSEKEEIEIMNKNEKQEKLNLKAKLNAKEIIKLQNLTEKVFMDESLKEYIKDIVFASRFVEGKKITELENMISFGASPRASLSLMKSAKAIALLQGRAFVIPEDIKEMALDVLRHRIVVSYEAEAENITSDQIVKIILKNVKVP